MGRNLAERTEIMAFTLDQWHARYLEQAQWTAPLRAFLLQQLSLPAQACVLETGCGTGALFPNRSQLSDYEWYGIDIAPERCVFAHKGNPAAIISCAEGIRLPFANATFDLTFCHYYLLWMNDAALPALREMARVTRPGGYVLAMAEPDYAARIDFPAETAQLGQLQNSSLQKQGAALDMGRRLPELFRQAGISEIQFGQSGFQREVTGTPQWLDSEWKVIAQDLADTLPPQEIAHLERLDRQHWQKGSRVLQIPTFYAYGKVKAE
jgi:SAM-dependent methyltransferase